MRLRPSSFRGVALAAVFLFAALASVVPAPARAVTIDMVTVGNAGNADDTGGSYIGRVDYSYQISKYDVTIGQYTAFLNAADPTGINPNAIYNSEMGTHTSISGISYDSTASDGSKYSAIGPAGTAYGQTAANRPITYVSWFDAARFANWMTNGQGGPGTTETGAYNLLTADPGVAPAKTPGAAFSIPTANEWYKAAYFSPNYGGPGLEGYYKYATQSDAGPGNIIGSGSNQANYHAVVWSVTQQGGDVVPNQNYLTDVGAFTNSPSYYGTFDQSGNVDQWNDLDGAAGTVRGLRGGYWYSGLADFVSSSGSNSRDPFYEHDGLGFRLVSVPEIDPSHFGPALVLVLGSLGLREHRRQAGRRRAGAKRAR